jgi:autotransporter family porin
LLALVAGGALVLAHYSGAGPAIAAHPAAAVRPAAVHQAAVHQAAVHQAIVHKAAVHKAAVHKAAVDQAAVASTTAASSPAFFHTLPPGAKLPSSAQCAAWVRARPAAENKGVNTPFNQRTGQSVGQNFFTGDTPAANRKIAPRINGNFTGTTKQILRWAACKWGINQNIVFAQAAVESWWRQTTHGDFDSDPTLCPPGHRHLNAQGQCPQSYGILQNRYPFEKASWPGIGRSTAMNADTAYAIWRTCFNGYETWLNTVPESTPYKKGDAWGCVGRWFSGRWHDAGAQQYIAKVKQYKNERIWTTKDFQEP